MCSWCVKGKGSSNEAAAAVQSGNDFGDRQAQVGSSAVTADTAGLAAGQQAHPYGQGNVSDQGSSLLGANYVQPQVEGSYVQPQALGGGNYTQ